MQSWAGVRRLTPSNKLLVTGALCILAMSTAVAIADKKEGKPAPASAQMVDSGSFGVFMHGQRVATETFSIHQSGSGSSIVSQFKSEAGADKAEQTSEWQMGPGGELRKYEWKELSPGQSQAVVVTGQDFLIERFKSGPQAKEQEQPFMLPATSGLLDDYFFIQREVLAWKYLATSCKQENGALQCPLKQRVQFGALNAHARSSVSVTVEFAGKEKVTIRGVEHELNRLDLNGESGNWALWLDDQFKLQRILIASENTEVVRD
ncbi:MAG TPA: hypothetical protein VN950_11700 [Terriglobales bacterium]|nr:hypothetical protein [Terriglobales bacterium]